MPSVYGQQVPGILGAMIHKGAFMEDLFVRDGLQMTPELRTLMDAGPANYAYITVDGVLPSTVPDGAHIEVIHVEVLHP